MQQLIGQRYKIEKLIGSGGMATVYQAVDTKLTRKVAIKILHAHMASVPEIRRRFQIEAQAISSLNHPSIVKIYDYSGLESADAWLVTEMIQGWNLGQFLNSMPLGRIHPLIASFIIREISRALAIVHEQGIIHRDIKPENVMLTSSGTIKIMDFGIAKDIHKNGLTMTGTFMGSPSYMSLEQIKGNGIDGRSDIYSLCVLFYEILTGKLPFNGNTSHDVVLKIVAGNFTSPKKIISYIPDVIEAIIAKGLQNNRERRFENAEEIVDLLDKFLFSQGFVESHVELERYFLSPDNYEERLKNKICKEYFEERDNLLERSSNQPKHVNPISVRKHTDVVKTRPAQLPLPMMKTTVFAYENTANAGVDHEKYHSAKNEFAYEKAKNALPRNESFQEMNPAENHYQTPRRGWGDPNAPVKHQVDSDSRPDYRVMNRQKKPARGFVAPANKGGKNSPPVKKQNTYYKQATRSSPNKLLRVLGFATLLLGLAFMIYNPHFFDKGVQEIAATSIGKTILSKQILPGDKPSPIEKNQSDLSPTSKTKADLLTSNDPTKLEKTLPQEEDAINSPNLVEIISDSFPLRIIFIDKTTGSTQEYIQTDRQETYEINVGTYEIKLFFADKVKKTKVFLITENAPKKRIVAFFKK